MMQVQENKTARATQWRAGRSDFGWLRQQALDAETLKNIDVIERDEQAYLQRGEVVDSDEEMTLRLRQGVFHTTRMTSHSVANVFVQIFKFKEHTKVPGFEPAPNQVVLDIGANEGYYALRMASAVATHVISIEPNPTAFRLLEMNVASNSNDSITLLQAAVWSSSGTGELKILPQVTGLGTMVVTNSSYMKRVEERIITTSVVTVTLSELIERHKLTHIDILKIDVEGAELDILEASGDELAAVKRIVMEYHSQELKDRAITLLESRGFVLVYEDPDRADFGDLYFRRSLLDSLNM